MALSVLDFGHRTARHEQRSCSCTSARFSHDRRRLLAPSPMAKAQLAAQGSNLVARQAGPRRASLRLAGADGRRHADLGPPEPSVESVAREQVVVATAFDDFSLLEHEDL